MKTSVILLCLLAVSVSGLTTPTRPDSKEEPEHICDHDHMMEDYYRSHGGKDRQSKSTVNYDPEQVASMKAYLADTSRFSKMRADPQARATRLVGNVAGSPIRIHVNDSFMLNDPQTCYTTGDYVMIGSAPNPNTHTPLCVDSGDNNCWVLCTEENVYTDSWGDFIRDTLMTATVDFLTSAYNVAPVVGPLTAVNDNCGFKGPIVGLGASYTADDADVIVLVTARPTVGTLLAYAGSCEDDSSGRTIMGHVNFAPNALDPTYGLTPKQFGVALHEIHHLLGFTQGKFSRFIDESSVVVPALGSMTIGTPPNDYTVDAMINPTVLEAARLFYDCPTLNGVPLENQGGSGTETSHWEKRIINDEFMAGSVSPVPKVSELTLALMEGTGWYAANYEVAEAFTYGQGLGCNFVEERCTDDNWPTSGGYLCTTDDAPFCTYDRESRGQCTILTYANDLPIEYQYLDDPTKGGSELGDYCPVIAALSNGDCRASYNAGEFDFQSGSWYSAYSSCFESNVLLEGYDGEDVDGVQCYPRGCSSSTSLRVLVGLTWLECENGEEHEVPNFQFKFYCPDATYIASVCADITGNPTVTDITPDSGDMAGGIAHTITGSGFVDGMFVTVAGIVCDDVEVSSTTTATCTTIDASDSLAESGDYKVHVIIPGNKWAQSNGDIYALEGNNDPLDIASKFLEALGLTKEQAILLFVGCGLLLILLVVLAVLKCMWRKCCGHPDDKHEKSGKHGKGKARH